ncbi:MAG: hypothetical protein J7K54_04360 [Candidatus Aenigmarchaeota archaeon]|nr:hypothetical protein [Candidatus Aenigmarchaeota archaeon]
MDSRIVLAGFVLVFIGMIVMVVGSMLGERGKAHTGSGGGFAVGGFIGPIPFGWATQKPLLYAVIVISVLFYIMSIILGHLVKV